MKIMSFSTQKLKNISFSCQWDVKKYLQKKRRAEKNMLNFHVTQKLNQKPLGYCFVLFFYIIFYSDNILCKYVDVERTGGRREEGKNIIMEASNPINFTSQNETDVRK